MTTENTPVRPSRIDFDNLDLRQLQRIVSGGSLTELTPQERAYYSLMEKVRGLRSRMRMNGRLVTKAGIIRNLREADGLSDYQARRVYADAVNFFYDQDDVRPRAWASLYAERCENMGNMLFAAQRPKEALRYLEMAARLRGCFQKQEAEIPDELLSQKPTVIYTTRSTDLGVPEPDRQRLRDFIDRLPEIPQVVRDNVKEDARVNTFNLKRRMLYDKREFADAEEVE